MEFLGLTTEQCINVGISLAILLIAILLVRWLLRYFLDFILTRLIGEKGKHLSKTLLHPMRRPLIYLIAVIAFQLALFRLTFLITDEMAGRLQDFFFVL